MEINNHSADSGNTADTKSPNATDQSSKHHGEKNLSNLQIASFCEEITMVLRAGISTYEGVLTLSENTPNPYERKIFEAICKDLENGLAFYEALSQTGVFPVYVLEMIKLGEYSGKLENVCSSLSRYYKREEEISQAIRGAVTYPILMVIMMFTVMIVLFARVLPVFNTIYTELGTTMTGLPAVFMHLSMVISSHLLFIVVVLILIVLICFLFHRSSYGKKRHMKSKIQLQIACARFANAMSLALGSGLDADQGLALSCKLVENDFILSKILVCQKMLKKGSSFLSALLVTQMFEPVYNSMLTIGDRTGSTEQTLASISEYYTNKADSSISHFISILEPMLVIILSVLIGLVLVSFLLPLIQLMSSIG